jgi:hypothetical protein
MKPIQFNIALIFSFLLILSGCREEIISPGNFAGNINEPITFNSSTYYSFIINAEDISTELIDYTYLYGLKSSCYVTILDYEKGNVEIIIAGRSSQILFHRRYSDNIPSSAIILEGNSPEIVQIKMSDFTGKLKFELNKL